MQEVFIILKNNSVICFIAQSYSHKINTMTRSILKDFALHSLQMKSKIILPYKRHPCITTLERMCIFGPENKIGKYCAVTSPLPLVQTGQSPRGSIPPHCSGKSHQSPVWLGPRRIVGHVLCVSFGSSGHSSLKRYYSYITLILWS